MTRETDWLVPAALVVAFEFAWGLSLALGTGAPLTVPAQTEIGLALAGYFMCLLAALIWQVRGCLKAADPRPLKTICKNTLDNWPRLVAALCGAALFGLNLPAYQLSKMSLGSFWADPWLAHLDRAIFGTDPWRLTHLFPFGRFIDWSYNAWFFLKSLTIVALLTVAPSRWKSRGLVSYFMLWALGSVTLHVLPSAGPIFYERAGFGTAFAELHPESQAATLSDNLWALYETNQAGVGSGISAMPSLHVAFAVWMAMVWYSADRRTAWVCIPLVGLIWFGSVYLGWHYALDGLAGIGLAAAAWKLAELVDDLPAALRGRASRYRLQHLYRNLRDPG